MKQSLSLVPFIFILLLPFIFFYPEKPWADSSPPYQEQPFLIDTLSSQILLESFRSEVDEESYDSTASVFVATTYKLPSSLTVNVGQSGSHWAVLTYKSPDGLVDCFYQGVGQWQHTSPPCTQDNGDHYRFAYCLPFMSSENLSCMNNPLRPACESHALKVTPESTILSTGFKLLLLGRDNCGDTMVEAVISEI